METKDPKYIFWADQVDVLYKNDNYLSFFPTTEMSRIEQLNALTRFCIYYTILILLFQKEIEYYYVSVILLLFIVTIYYLYKSDIQGKYSEVQRQFTDNNQENYNPTVQGDVGIEAGYLDSDNNIISGKYYSKDAKKKKSNISLDKLLEYEKGTCRRPTRDNPFMNPNTVDYNNGDQPIACNADDEDIKNEITDNYNLDLFRDVDDLFDVKNSQRQFYTVPNTQIPNDQTAFANWCYKTKDTCKVNQERCLRYEDVRNLRDINARNITQSHGN